MTPTPSASFSLTLRVRIRNVPSAFAEVAQASEADLKVFVKDRLAAYKYPRQIEFVAELPKTATGKIQRFKLRERELPAPT